MKIKMNQDFFPIKKFNSFHKDANINYQLNRFLIAGLENLYAEIGRHTDYAMGLYRAAEFFMSPADPDRKMVIEKFLLFFYQSKKDKNLEQISVPYENNHLHGFRLTPTISLKGTVIIHGGFDSYIEEFYTLGAAICEEGYEVIMFDGPGQGSTLMFGKLPMAHEWEKPVAAVLDYTGAENVTLIGISLGGYLAIRAASVDKRIQRVIAYDVMLDFFDCITSRRGKVAAIIMKSLVKLKMAFVLNAAAKILIKKDMYSQWGIAQGMHVTGCKKPYEFFFKLKQYNGYAASTKITADVLIMAGAEDHFVSMKQFYKQLALLTGAKSVTSRIFTEQEQAQSHCQIGNLGLAAMVMLAWIEEHN
jgi:pimeloyl-ACP methyl ester carboxylesterase